MDLLKLSQALQCHLGNAVLKRVLPEALDETWVTTPRALAEYLRLPEVSCALRVPSAEHGRQMRELVELRAKLVDFESFLARVDASLQALGEGDADRAEREKVEPLQHRRREAIALLKTKLLQLESQLRPFGLELWTPRSSRRSTTRRCQRRVASRLRARRPTRRVVWWYSAWRPMYSSRLKSMPSIDWLTTSSPVGGPAPAPLRGAARR